MARYSLQEMKLDGFTYYEIMDTENNCSTLYTSKDYVQICKFMQYLEANKDMPVYYGGKEI